MKKAGTRSRFPLSAVILLAVPVGIALGVLWPEQAQGLHFLFDIFLRLIKCIVAPLIFSTLVAGIAGHAGDLKSVGRLAVKALVYFEVVTTLALFIGLAAANFLQPGAGMHLGAAANGGEQSALTFSLTETVTHMAPQSFFDAAARNDLLEVAVFAALFGMALTQVKEDSRRHLLSFFEAVAETMFKLTGIVMWLAPVAVAAAVAWAVGKNGLGAFASLGKLVLTLYAAFGALVIFVFIPVLWLARISPRAFFAAIRRPALLAFSTASSESALPDAFRVMEKFGVPERVVSFVLPTGYSFNLDGTTLYLSVALLFVAQAAGVHLSPARQLPMMFTLMLASKGAAGVPRAALAILTGALATFDLPAEGAAVLLAVDAFCDMGRSAVNLTGNCLAAAVVARWEGELSDEASGAADGTPARK